MVVFVFSLICYLVLIGYFSHYNAVVVLWYHSATFVTNNHLYHEINWIYTLVISDLCHTCFCISYHGEATYNH